jgi:hypothetical protein
MRIALLSFAVLLGAGCYASSEPFPDAGRDAADVGADDAVADVPVEAPFCGDEKEPRATLSNIVAGQPTFDPSVVELNDGQVLAVGAMLTRDPRTGSLSTSCSATLVTDTVVLLAAHCVLGWTGVVRPADVRFSVGRDVADPEHVFEVSEVHYNTAYRPWGGEQARADEAVLVLAESASEAIPGIRPIPINREPLPDGFLGARVQTVGFGSTEPGGGGGNTVRWWTTEEVTEVTDYDFTLYGGGVSSVCYGDSGGPALFTFPDGRVRVAGTVSWGDDSCVDYDHFTRTDHNLDFLYRYVGDEPVDPCGGLTWEGRCEPGEVAVWCIDGVTYRRDCAACDQTCGDAGPSLGYYCL